MWARALILLLTPLPRHAMTSVAGWLANRRIPRGLRPLVHRAYCRVFGARADDAEHGLDHYETVNAFFTRTLKPGLRPIAANALACPCDGTAGAAGPVERGTLLQAKGHTYSLAALLGDDRLAQEMEGGTSATLYLSPKDYHRFHVPLAADVVGCTYIPGELWPVNGPAVKHVDGLFAVNERLVVELRRPEGGVMALVAVGATMVGMTRLAFDDVHTHARRRRVDRRRYQPAIHLEAGAVVGNFEFGSTLVLVCSRECGALNPPPAGTPIRVGQDIGTLGR